ncbi:MAG: transcription-repair coupling factor [Gammaproteobacteria bacterium]|nr:MAG: transcription-repair coupling factor [Gammaproteobacteria bacterium]
MQDSRSATVATGTASDARTPPGNPSTITGTDTGTGTGGDASLTLLSRRCTADLPARAQWGQLHGAAQSLAIAELAATSEALTVVVVPNTAELLQFEPELRFFLDGRATIHTLSDWETLPYDRVSPHQDIVSERIRTLYRLPSLDRGILLLSAAALMQRLPPRAFLEQHALLVQVGDTLPLDTFRERLVDAGYRLVSQVEEHGEFAVRGSILDLFPMTSDMPLRMEFFDDELETIRRFDPDTQLTDSKVEKLELLPAHEFPMNEDGIGTFRRQYRNHFPAESRNTIVYNEISEGRTPSGIEYYLPLFFEATAVLFDYLPAGCRFVLTEGAEAALADFAAGTADRHEQWRHDIERPILAPEVLYLSPDEVTAAIARHPCIDVQRGEIDSAHADNFGTRVPGVYPVNARAERPMGPLQDFLGRFAGRVLFAAESTGRREALLDQLHGNRLRPQQVSGWRAFLESNEPLCLTTAALDRGLELPSITGDGGSAGGLALITEQQLGAGRVRRRERRRATRDSDAIIANLSDLSIGAPVVHIDHGVGRYQGLTRLAVGDSENEYVTIHYAGDDKLYVPVTSLHLISRYSGASEDSAPLHALGSDAWQKAKKKAAEKAHDVAAELLEIHARRAARKGHAFPADSDNYARFAADFPFEETPDQQHAIDEVIADLRREQPTDRVVCGDVGFGKTEVAMRAAFVAVDGGRQVAVLVPTTLLARQHYQSFIDRYADWPVQIESLSRFDTAKEQKAILQRLEAGGIDIIIGTHKLLSRDIRYRNLGLVIIDEEHRFGVRHKEHMKALRAEVDILTLTATPIPRTLNMGLAGMRDLSIIATPPQHRHAIKTFVGEWNDVQIREACERELARGGQVYFLHNDVQTIERMVADIERIVPQARVEFAHGQMRESELEQVMVDFYHQRFNILVATTIIESGIDVPSANTIIINRADKLGLAQLHQLRGRVGRSHHRAYAYLVTPPVKALTADAKKRLDAIESLEDLGVGFTLATHDLEIRGAGELLGEDQSGQIQAIGFTLYRELLERAVKALKRGEIPDTDSPLAAGSEVDLGAAAVLPEDYVPDVHQRLVLYKRISAAEDTEALRDLKIELIDRFGLLPPQTERLFEVMRLRQRCETLGITRLEASESGARLQFVAEPRIDPMTLLTLIQAEPARYRFDGKSTLRVIEDHADTAAAAEAMHALLDRLTPDEAA